MDHDVVWITAELRHTRQHFCIHQATTRQSYLGNIFLNPFKQSKLVTQAVIQVPVLLNSLASEEAVYANAVVEVDLDDAVA